MRASIKEVIQFSCRKQLSLRPRHQRSVRNCTSTNKPTTPTTSNNFFSSSSLASSSLASSSSSIVVHNNIYQYIRKHTKESRYYFSSLIPKNNDDIATKTSTSTLPSVPINFDTSSSIQGEESQILQVNLEPNQILRAESGAMLFMTQGVEMSTSLGGNNSGSSSGTSALISDGFKRMLTGQNLFISDYTYHGPQGTKGTVALGTDFPSKIIRLSLKEYGYKVVCQKSAYLASDLNVDIQMEYAKKFTTGFFGGEGFILQALVGDGDVFVKAGG